MQPTTSHDTIYGFAALGTHLFVARSSGLYHSTDGGRTWRYAYEALLGDQPLPTLCVALSPAFPIDGMLLAGAGGAVMVSYDRSRTWEALRFDPPPPVVNAIAISPDFARDGMAFLATLEDGVFCSTNHGRTWTNWNFGLLDANVQCLAVSPGYAQDRTVLAGVSSGLFRSENGARSWQGLPLPSGYASITSLAFSPTYPQDGSLFAGAETGELFRSTDHGKIWNLCGAGLGSGAIYSLLLAPDFATTGSLLALTESGVMLSTDRGLHFSPWLPNRLPDAEISALCAPDGFTEGKKVYLGVGDAVIEVRV